MLLKRYKEFSTLETNPEWQKNLQATPDMELIRQQFEGLNKYDPIKDNDLTATVVALSRYPVKIGNGTVF